MNYCTFSYCDMYDLISTLNFKSFANYRMDAYNYKQFNKYKIRVVSSLLHSSFQIQELKIVETLTVETTFFKFCEALFIFISYLNTMLNCFL